MRRGGGGISRLGILNADAIKMPGCTREPRGVLIASAFKTTTAALLMTLLVALFSHTAHACEKFFTYKDDFRGTEAFLEKELVGRRLRVLFVPGFFSDALRTLKHYGVQYFDAQAGYLRRLGVDAQIVGDGQLFGGPWDSEAPMAHNAAFLKSALREANASPRSVIMIGHSKGGLDTLYMLLQTPEIADRLYGNISIQSPYEGSPLADWVRSLGPVAQRVVAWTLRRLGGAPETLDEFRTERARAWLEGHAGRVGQIFERLPLILYGSSLADASGGNWVPSPLARPLIPWMRWPPAPYALARDWPAVGSPHNDGAVTVASSQGLAAFAPATSIVEYRVDHMMPVTPRRDAASYGPEGDYDRIAAVNAMLRILIEDAESRDHARFAR